MSDIPFLERFGDALEAAAARQRPVRKWQAWLRPVPLSAAGTALAAVFVLFTVVTPLINPSMTPIDMERPQPGLQTFEGPTQTGAPALGDDAMRSSGAVEADSQPRREEPFSTGAPAEALPPAPAAPLSAPFSQAPMSQALVWDDRILLDLDVNVVFVGRVLASTEIQEPRLEAGEMASTVPFDVAVVKTIKGDLGATVTVAQPRDGVDGAQDRTFAAETAALAGGSLEPGSTYLFVAGERLEDGRYPLLNHPNARMPISTDADATLTELEEQASQHPRVVALEEMCESLDAC